jgi:hypothetical protein
MTESAKPLRLAILMAGRIFNYKDAYPNIMENIVQGNIADFFLSHSPELDEDLEDFRRIFQPKILNNDPHSIKVINPAFQHQNRENVIKMLYNRQRIFDDFKKYMADNHVTYDLIISYRADTISFDKLDYSIFKDMGANAIYIPRDFDWSHIGTCDQMAFGNLAVMEKYMTIYNDIDRYLGVQGTRITGEELVYRCLAMNNIQTIRFTLKHRLSRIYGWNWPPDTPYS